nr:hypothetical protein [Tanacetum cinerariifolium]
MLFNNTIKWIESFVSMDTELVKGNEIAAEGSSKRATDKLQQEDAKRQRIEEENKSAELKKCLEIIPDYDDNMVYYLLVEKMYPFTRNILHQMWNDVSLQVDYEVEMAYDLLRLIRRTRTSPATATATTPMTDAAIRALIAQGAVDTLAEQEIQRNTNLNGDES